MPSYNTMLSLSVNVASVDCMSIWLANIGISSSTIPSYIQMFAKEKVNEMALEGMTFDQLGMIGICALGPRSLIFNSAQEGM